MADIDTVDTTGNNDEVKTQTSEGTNAQADVSQASTSQQSQTDAGANDQQEKSLRDVLSDTFDRVNAEHEEKVGGVRKVEKAPGAKPAEQQSAAPTKEVDPITGREVEPIKAPNGWTPVMREKWKGLPRDVQQFIADNEKQRANDYSKLGVEAKFAKSIQKEGEKILPYLKQSGLTLEQATHRLYQEAHLLWAGNAHQKAAFIGSLIKQFRPDANTLRAVLNGQVQPQAPAQQQAPVDLQKEREKWEAEQQQMAALQPLQTAIEAFKNDPANEWAHDLEEKMAIAIDKGFINREGKDIKQILKDAYDWACNNDPEVRKVLAERGQANPVGNTPAPQKVIQPIRSPKPSLGAGNPVKVPKKKYPNARAVLEERFDEVAARVK